MRSRASIYKLVTQLVILDGSERWVVTGEMLKFLTGFHHQAAKCVTRMTEKRGSGGEREHLVVEEAM